MKYSIKVNEVKRNEGSLKGFATVTFGESFKVTNIAILQANDERMFISMPRYKTNQKDEKGRAVYKDICNPIVKEFRDNLYNDIIQVFSDKANMNQEKSNNILKMPSINVSVSPYEREGSSIKALARVVLDDSFVINNITVLEGINGDKFVAMPGYKTNKQDEQGKYIYKDICYPVTAEFRVKMYGELMESYEKAIFEKLEKISPIVKEKSKGYEAIKKESRR